MILKRGRIHDFAAPPSNPGATKEARLLYARLKNCFGSPAGSSCPMFIGMNETAAVSPYMQANGDHFRSLTGGKTPLLLAPFWVRPGSTGYAEQVARAKAHYAAGGMCGVIWHPDNLLTGGNNYDRDRDSFAAVTECLSPSGSVLSAYRARLDEFADSLNNDFVVDGVRIPMLVRTAGEANGWYNYPDMSVTSLTRSGTVATMHFIRGANPLANAWAAGVKFQVRGASDAKWNKLWTATSYVKDGDSNGGTVTFTCTGNETSSPSGVITTYPTTGAWWAGDDRAAALNALIQQTITYMRDTKGCNQLLWGPNLFTWNRIYLSSNPATYSYSLWLSGMENYYDFVSINLYQDEDPVAWPYIDFGHQSIVDGFQPFVDWCDQYQRPIMVYEFGAKIAGQTTANFWSQKCFDAFDTKFRRIAGVTLWSKPWMPEVGSSAAADFAQVMARDRYRYL